MEFPPVSASFRKQVHRVMGSIVLFMIVYLLLVAAAVALAILCCVLGFWLILSLSHILIIIVGLGIVAVGVSVFVFLIKFIFSVSKAEDAEGMEIQEVEQPQLFAFIRELTAQTETRFPKKIVLVPDVNAAVFYNSSFWSMFLPTRKNLKIGLGLVNSMNLSEFKAVMAHEFGHFSQRSMKLGSFTYNVNKIIHNMLYENTGYTNFLNGWGRIHSVLGFFARVTVWIAEGIQWILQKMYRIVNKSYMGLSREMEFHADAMAAAVAGGNNVISGLSRSRVANSCYQSALGEANTRGRDNLKSRNIFANQLTIFRSYAEDHSLPLEKGIPKVSFSFVSGFSQSRINFKDQWASHPTLEERKQHLDTLGIEMEADSSSAWSLFADAEGLQERMTEHLYREATFKEEPRFYEVGDFEREFYLQKEKYALPATYKGFYDGRFPETGNWDFDALLREPAPAIQFEDLFSDATGQLRRKIESNRKDMELAMAIKQQQVDVKSFDFDGMKYDRKDGEKIAEQLKQEVAQVEMREQELDKQAFLYFINRPGADRERIVAGYRAFRQAKLDYDGFVKVANAALEKIRPFYGGTSGIDTVNRIVAELKSTEERDLKEGYRRLLRHEGFGDAAFRARVQTFLDSDYAYFVAKRFRNNELDVLKDLAIEAANVFNEYLFRVYKKMLEEQLADDGSGDGRRRRSGDGGQAL